MFNLESIALEQNWLYVERLVLNNIPPSYRYVCIALSTNLLNIIKI